MLLGEVLAGLSNETEVVSSQLRLDHAHKLVVYMEPGILDNSSVAMEVRVKLQTHLLQIEMCKSLVEVFLSHLPFYEVKYTVTKHFSDLGRGNPTWG